MTTQKRFRAFHLVFFLILLAVNGWIFLNRDNGFAYREVRNYEQLYNDTADLSTWLHISPYTTDEDIVSAQAILRDSIKINDQDSTLAKVQKIGWYIVSVLDTHRGVPSAIMNDVSPMQEFNYARMGKSKVWCGNFANIFSFFANTAGIPTRYVAQEGDKNNVHVFNECFIKELGQWIFVDLTSHILQAKNISGQYLNAFDLYHYWGWNPADATASLDFNKGVVNEPFCPHGVFHKRYLKGKTLLVYYLKCQFALDLYSFTSKFERYVTPSPTFVCYSDEKASNTKFYLKAFFFYLLVAFLIYWGFAWMRRRGG